MSGRRKPEKSLLSRSAGARRRAHFEQGGTLADWRGRAVRFVDRRRKADKSAARGRTHRGGES